jgi:hypothetical protein
MNKGNSKLNTANIIARMEAMARTTKNDALSNNLLRIAHRLAHQGALFEKPLSRDERRIVAKFAGMEG